MKKLIVIILTLLMIGLMAPSCKTNSYGHKVKHPYKKKPKKNCKCPQFSYLEFSEEKTYVLDNNLPTNSVNEHK